MPKNSDETIALVALIAIAAWLLIGLPIIYSANLANLHNWLTHDAAGLFTLGLLLIGVAQAFLFFVQLKYLRESLSHTATSANAARDGAVAAAESARIARNAERPYFFPLSFRLENWDGIVSDLDEVLKVRFNVSNSGKGIGFIRSYGIVHEICKDGAEGKLELIVRDQFGRMPLHSNGKWKPEVPFHVFQLTEDERESIFDFRDNLYVYGYLAYTDLFDIARRTGFAYELIINRDDPTEGVLVEHPGPLWYDQEEVSTAVKMAKHSAAA
jgi:hypothetical protein